MSLLNDAQKSALFARVLGIDRDGTAASVPERAPPTGTDRGTEPSVIAAMAQNRTIMIVGGVVLVVAALYLAKKL